MQGFNITTQKATLRNLPLFSNLGKLSPVLKIALWIMFQFFLGILLCHDVLGYQLGRVHPDEKYHLKIIVESLDNASLASPVLNGEPWYTKPPLLLWLGYGIGKLSGLGSFAGMRVVATMSWMLCSVFIFGFVTRSLGTAYSKDTAQSQAVKTTILSTSFISILSFSHFGMMDIPMLASLLSVLFLTQVWLDSGQKTTQTAALTLALAVGGWWKGPVFYVLIFLPILAIFPPVWHKIKDLFVRFYGYIVLSLIVGNAWVLWNLYSYGDWYLQKFILGENLTRINDISLFSASMFILLGSIPFWRETLCCGFFDIASKLEYRHTRAGLMLAVSIMLVFGFCGKQHFHWFVGVPVGLLLWSGIPTPHQRRFGLLEKCLSFLIAAIFPCLAIIFLIIAAYAQVSIGLFSKVLITSVSLLILIVAYQSLNDTQRSTLGVMFTFLWGLLFWIVTPKMVFNIKQHAEISHVAATLDKPVRKFNQNNGKKIPGRLWLVLKEPSKQSVDNLMRELVIEV